MFKRKASSTNNSTQHQLLAAMHYVLKPLVKLALAYGVSYPMLTDMLKSVFVAVAEDDFKLDKKEQTDSRVSLLTGIHRKDVHRLRANTEFEQNDYIQSTLGSQLVALWITDSDFTDGIRIPKPLPRLASIGGASSFENLVAKVSKDIRARPVLDEWLRIGVAYMDENDCVCLNCEAFVPTAGFEEKLFFFQKNVHDHIATTTHNMMNIEPAMFERCVYYDTLTPDDIAELKKMSLELGMLALKSVNVRAIELQKKAKKSQKANQRFTFSMYFYYADEDSATSSVHEEHIKNIEKSS